MKVLSLTQPWASLVVGGAKRWETRTWRTSYRGPLGIHAAKSFPQAARELLQREPFASALLDVLGVLEGDSTTQADDAALDLRVPVGCILGTARLVAIVATEEVRDTLDATERAFGNFGDRRWAWHLQDPIMFDKPIPCSGGLGIWDWEPDAAARQPYRPYGGQPPAVAGSETSAAAAESLLGFVGTLREKVLRYVERCGEEGTTDDEIERALSLRHQTASARRRELEQMGLVRATGRKRKTSSGRYAQVYVHAEAPEVDARGQLLMIPGVK
jgi:predicted transcriptional regulator